MSNQEYCDEELIDVINSPIAPSTKPFFSKIFLLDKASSIIGSIAIVLLFSQNVLAQSFAGYCISATNETNLEPKRQATLSSKKQNLSLSVSNGDRSYQISVDPTNKRKVLLRSENQQKPLDKMILSQDGGQIKNLILGEDNWLWIDRYAIDYLMKINFSAQSAYFESPIKLPELSSEPCHLLRRLFEKCQHGQYSYSSSLNRVFVSGYPIKSWRKQKYIHLEFISGNKHPVPESLQEALFMADIPQWNGALFKLPSGEALFYDGVTVTNLSDDFIKLEEGENFQEWNLQQTLGKRTFIGKFSQRSPEDPLLLMELEAEPGFKPIYLPKDLKYQWFKLLMMPDDAQSTLWIISRKMILAEIEQSFKTVIRLPPSTSMDTFIDGAKSIKQLADGKILFEVYNYTLKSTKGYLLSQVSSEAQCETVLDLEQPFLLDIERQSIK